MKSLAFIAAAVVTLGAPAIASAQTGAGNTGVYGGLGYNHYDDHGANADYGGVTGRLGYRFHPNFGVEGEATFSTNDDENTDFNNAYGVYGVGFLPVSQNFDLLARVGYSRINADGKNVLKGVQLDDDGVGYGVGAQYSFSSNWGVRGDYTRHDGDRDINTWGATLTRRF